MTCEASDLKLIRYNANCINRPDNPMFPFRLELHFRLPEFMTIAAVCFGGGSDEVVVCGKTKEALVAFVDSNEFKTHPGFRRLVIIGPEGVVEEFER